MMFFKDRRKTLSEIGERLKRPARGPRQKQANSDIDFLMRLVEDLAGDKDRLDWVLAGKNAVEAVRLVALEEGDEPFKRGAIDRLMFSESFERCAR